MQLRFRNDYGVLAWVCIAFRDTGACAPYGGWGTRGWWNVHPGGEAFVLNTTNRYAYFYAEAADGSVWAGPFGPVLAPRRAFDSCWDIGNNVDPYVYMREVYVAGDRHTVRLIRGS